VRLSGQNGFVHRQKECVDAVVQSGEWFDEAQSVKKKKKS
jgi:hypothetical protein